MDSIALVLGEAVADVVNDSAVPGGSAVITAVALARLGREVRIATSYAEDADGRLIADFLSGSAVRPACDPHITERTCRSVASLRSDGSADYRFDIDWDLAPVELAAGESPLVVHASGFAAVLSPGAETIAHEFRRWRDIATISYDLNVRTAITGSGPEVRRAVEELVALADVVKASDEDLEAIWPGVPVADTARGLLAAGAAVVVMTRGARGASWFTAGTAGDVPPIDVEVADTIGAGDTFQAALLDALWSHDLLGAASRDRLRAADDRVWDDVIRWATRVAAVTVSRTGGNPPSRGEVPSVG